jgi:recombination protein RecA
MSNNAEKITEKELTLALAKLEKQFGKNTIFTGDVMPDDVDVISTGNFLLDLKLGVGGLPKGRIIEIFGGEGLGKSLLSLSTVAACQKAGGRALYVDAECDLSPEWAETLGVDMDTLYISQPEYGEAGLQVVMDMVATGGFDLVVVDSVAALTPKAELEGTLEDSHVGLQARMMGQALRMMRQSISDTGTCVIFINQVRDKIGFMANGGTTTPGGRALKFFSSVRIELKKMGDLKDSKTGESRGTRIKANILKNKVGTPMKTLEYNVIHGLGFNNGSAVLEEAKKLGLVQTKGAYYYKVDFETGEVSDKTFAQGEMGAIDAFDSDPQWASLLTNKVKERFTAK